MFKLIAMVLTLGVSSVALANDGGMAYIDVKGIAPVKKAGNGTEIKFYGKDAANFMRLLPGYSNVLYSMVTPEVAKQLQKNNRGVALISNKWSLSFNCSAGDISSSEDIKQAKFVSKQPECTISLSKNYLPGNGADDLGDAWSMEARDYEAKVCQ